MFPDVSFPPAASWGVRFNDQGSSCVETHHFSNICIHPQKLRSRRRDPCLDLRPAGGVGDVGFGGARGVGGRRSVDVAVLHMIFLHTNQAIILFGVVRDTISELCRRCSEQPYTAHVSFQLQRISRSRWIQQSAFSNHSKWHLFLSARIVFDLF
jgi:hypothetical protein